MKDVANTELFVLAPRKWMAGCALILATSLFLSLRFVGVQVIHVDETTQLSGASIPPLETMRWLAGENPARFGVPSDRMPPLFYLLQQAWAVIFGTSITAYRALSLASAFIGLLFFTRIVRRISPGIWGLAVLATLALSMNYLQYSIVIRPYPLFFALACAGCYALMRYCEVRGTTHETRWHVVIAAIGIVAAYTHFYGVVMFCAMQAAMAILALRERRSIWPNIFAVTVSALFCLGLYPIFVASLDVHTAVVEAKVADFPKLVYRIVASRSAAVYLPVQFSLLVGLALAASLSLVNVATRSIQEQRLLESSTALRFLSFVIVALSLTVSLFAAAVVRGLNALDPNYHIWLFPFVYSLLLLPRGQIVTLAAKVQAAGISLALLGTAASAYVFYRNMSFFVSSPLGAMQSAINKLPQGTPVIYDNNYASVWYFSSYPIRYVYQGKVRQYLSDTANPEFGFLIAEANNLFFAPKLDPASEAEVLGASEYLIYAHVDNMFVDQSTRFIRYGEPSIPDDKRDRRFAERFGYEVIENGYYPGYAAIRISVLKRKQ